MPVTVVRHNEWNRVARAGEPRGPAPAVSVVIPCFDAPGALALTMAGLERQDWPRDRLEVVIVDDGSEPPLELPEETSLALRLVRRQGREFSLAAARNAGARVAVGAVLVFLDADMIAEAGLVTAHAGWQRALPGALTLGFRACVSVAGIDADTVRNRPDTVRALLGGRAFDPPWQERLMAVTGDLTARREDLFRATAGNNLGISRALFEEVGGFDESFDRYGGEDIEFAWRVQVRGGVLVPVREALAWHQGRWREGRRAKRRDLERQRATLADRIAVPGFRRAFPGRRFAVPRHAVTLAAGGEPPPRIARAARQVLADVAGDAAVRIDVPPDTTAGAIAAVQRALPPDPRLAIAGARSALDAQPHAPLHLALPAAAIRPGILRALTAALGNRAAVEVRLGDGARATAAWAWALHRARRTGVAVREVGDTATVDLKTPGPLGRLAALAAARAGRLLAAACALPGPAGRGCADLARVLDEARHVRCARDAGRFLRWLRAGAMWRLRRGR